MPKVSVLMPAYNSAKYIEQSIQSILNQTFKDFELIIVNDGSTDNTHEVISSFTDNRIRYFQNEGNKGLSFVRNRLLYLATADYIAFIDSDDYSFQNRMQIEYDLLKNNPELGLVSSSVYSLDEFGNTNKENWRLDLDSDQLNVHLLFYNPIVTSTVMFKKNCLPAKHFREDYPPCEDYDLWVRMLFKAKGKVLPDFLSVYRIYSNSVSKRKVVEAYANRNRIVTEQLDNYFNHELVDTDKIIHLSLVEYSLKNSTSDIMELKAWILKLLQLNAKHKYFDEKILKQVLYGRILKKYLRLSDYNFSVYKSLLEMKEMLQPDTSWEIRKKEIAIMVFSIAHKKLIHN